MGVSIAMGGTPCIAGWLISWKILNGWWLGVPLLWETSNMIFYRTNPIPHMKHLCCCWSQICDSIPFFRMVTLGETKGTRDDHSHVLDHMVSEAIHVAHGPMTKASMLLRFSRTSMPWLCPSFCPVWAFYRVEAQIDHLNISQHISAASCKISVFCGWKMTYPINWSIYNKCLCGDIVQ